MAQSEECVVCLDMGTTRTRAWLVVDGQVKIRLAEDFGVRDRAISTNPVAVEEQLRALLLRVTQPNRTDAIEPIPTHIAAAGMIGAPSGLVTVPHVLAPADADKLSACVQIINRPNISKLPFFIVPGVRTAAITSGIEGIESGDLMRGEESLCVGLLQSGQLQPSDAVLNLGSHWKWILIGQNGSIERSRTSLTGELIHSVQAHTLLASALPQHRPVRLASDWLEHGAQQARQEGLTRALFCVRLLEQNGEGNPEELLSYLYGAVLETEISAVRKSAFFASVRRVVIAGAPALAVAWANRMAELGWNAATLTEAEVEQAYLDGLRAIVKRSRLCRNSDGDAWQGQPNTGY